MPAAASFFTAASRPFWRIQARSPIVFFVPGSTTRSGSPSCPARSTYRTPSAEWLSSGEKSVKLEMRGRRTTAMSNGRRCCVCARHGARLSSSSMSARV